MPTEYAELHIIAQAYWHSDAYLVGNRLGLLALRDAINRALAGPDRRAECLAWPNDGERYSVIVHLRDNVADVPYGYTDEMARPSPPKAWPEWLR